MNILHTCPTCGEPTTIERTPYFVKVMCLNCLDYWTPVYYDGCCPNPELVTRKLITESGVPTARKQCINCGDTPGTALGGFSKAEREALPPIDKELKEAYSTKKWDLIKAFHEERRLLTAQRQSQRDTLWWRQYKIYTQSQAWLRLRSVVLKRDNYTCQACLSRPATEVHHKSYEFVDFQGNEPCFDLISMCRPCHEKLHQMRNLKNAS